MQSRRYVARSRLFTGMNITLLKDFFKSLFLFLNSYTQDSSFVAPIYSLIRLKHFYKILTDTRGHVYLKLTIAASGLKQTRVLD